MAYPLQDGRRSQKAVSHRIQLRRQTASLHRGINGCHITEGVISDEQSG